MSIAYTSEQKEILCLLEKEKLQHSHALINTYQQISKSNNPSTTAHLLESFKTIKRKRKRAGDFADWQQQLAREMVVTIENDPEQQAYDPVKLQKFQLQSGIPAEETCKSNNHDITTTVRKGLNYFTSARLFLLRLNRMLSLSGLAFLPPVFLFLGLSYALELLAGVAGLLWDTFAPPIRSAEVSKSRNNYWQIYSWRLSHALTADPDFIPDMINAVVWLAVNILCITLAGPAAFVLVPVMQTQLHPLICACANLGAFVFDYCNEFYKGLKDYIRHKRTFNAVKAELEELRQIQHPVPDIKKQIRAREEAKSQLQMKINRSIVPARLYQLGVALMILVGMALVYFPPTLPAGVALALGGSLAMGGSVFGGFGKKLAILFTFAARKIYSFFKPPEIINEKKIEKKADKYEASIRVYQVIKQEEAAYHLPTSSLFSKPVTFAPAPAEYPDKRTRNSI